MKCFKYKIYKDSKLVFMNYINRESEEEALADLESVKLEHKGTEIKIIEV